MKNLTRIPNSIYQLFAEGYRDPVVLAVIATELSFTSSWRRCGEYLYWLALTFLDHPRADYVSVGIAQVQVRHWYAAGFCSRSRVWETLRSFASPQMNYAVCREVLRGLQGNANITLPAAYQFAGQVRRHYVRVVTRCYRSIVCLRDHSAIGWRA